MTVRFSAIELIPDGNKATFSIEPLCGNHDENSSLRADVRMICSGVAFDELFHKSLADWSQL
jgi:hypothetical protein